MRTITNNYNDLEVWNLDAFTGQRGPFLVVQMGIAPDDERLRPGLFILRPDGRWVDALYYLASGKPELLDEAIFQDTQQVMALLDRLDPKPEMAEAPLDEASLKTWLESTQGTDPMQRVRDWLEQYRQRHRGRAS